MRPDLSRRAMFAFLAGAAAAPLVPAPAIETAWRAVGFDPGPASVLEIDAMMQAIWDNYAIHPTHVLWCR